MRRMIFVLVLTITMILCGCTRRIALTPQDEITMNTWGFKGQNGYNATLEFNGATAEFHVYDNEKCTASICGAYYINETEFTVTDTNLLASFTFKYILHGDTVSIAYDNTQIEMKRQTG